MQKCEPITVVEEARRWVGTPFQHRWHRIGVGADCFGVVRGVGEALGLIAIAPDIQRAFESYAKTPKPFLMVQAMDLLFERADIPNTETASDGHIAWIEWRAELPTHLAITATHRERPTLIHSLRNAGKCVEHGFTSEWRRRVHSYWRFPNVSYP